MTRCANCQSQLNRSELDSDYPICPNCGCEFDPVKHSPCSTTESEVEAIAPHASQPSKAAGNTEPTATSTPPLPTPALGSTNGSGGPDGFDLRVARTLADGVEELPVVPGLDIVGVIGRGGMGCVYEAKQLSLGGRRVAVKHLPDRLAKSSHFMSRFTQEAEVLARVSHPNIVAVFDFQTEGHSAYLVMELVDGPRGKPADLNQLIRAREIDEESTRELILQVLSALSTAHQEGVVHRDIKPGNIMLDRNGNAKVVDFGLASILQPQTERELTVVGKAMGTIDYMSPEQAIDASSVDARTDIYSVGVLLYEMLTGRLPKGAFRRPSDLVAGISTQWDRIVDRAMQQEPAERYQSAAEMLADISTLNVQASVSFQSSRSSLEKAEDRSLPLESRLEHAQHALAILAELKKGQVDGEFRDFEVAARRLTKELAKKCGEFAEQNQNFSAALRHYSYLEKLVPNSMALQQRLDKLESHREQLVKKATDEFRTGEFRKALRTLDIAVMRYPEDQQLRETQQDWTEGTQRLEAGAQQLLKLRAEKGLFAMQSLLQDLCSTASGRRCFGKLKEQIDQRIAKVWKEVQALQSLLRNREYEQLDYRLRRLRHVVLDCPEVNQLQDSLDNSWNPSSGKRRRRLVVGFIAVLIVCTASAHRLLFPDTWLEWQAEVMGILKRFQATNLASDNVSPVTVPGGEAPDTLGAPNRSSAVVPNTQVSENGTTNVQALASQLAEALTQEILSLDTLLNKSDLMSATVQVGKLQELLQQLRENDPRNNWTSAVQQQIQEREEVILAGQTLNELLAQIDTFSLDSTTDLELEVLASAKHAYSVIHKSKWPLIAPENVATRLSNAESKLATAMEHEALRTALSEVDEYLDNKAYLDAKEKLEKLPPDNNGVSERWVRFNDEYLAGSGQLQIDLEGTGISVDEIERIETRVAGELLTHESVNGALLSIRWLPGRHPLQLTLDAKRYFSYVSIKQGVSSAVKPRLAVPTVLATLGPNSRMVQTIDISPDGKTSAAAISSQDFLQCDLLKLGTKDLNKAFREQFNKGLYRVPNACDFSPEGQFFVIEWRASREQHSCLSLKDAGDFEHELVKLVTPDPDLDLGMLRASVRAQFVAGWDPTNKRVILWDTRQQSSRVISDYATGISTLNFDTAGTGLFVASSNPQLPIDYFTYPQMEVARSKQLHGLEYPCSDIVHDAVANRVVGIGGSTQQSECQVVVWDFESANVDMTMRLSLAQRFQTVKLSRGGEFAFIGTQGGTIEVFDIGMQKRLDMPVVNLGDTTRSITAIDISANGRYLLAGDSLGILHYIELPIELSEYAVAPPKPLPKGAFSEPPETKSP